MVPSVFVSELATQLPVPLCGFVCAHVLVRLGVALPLQHSPAACPAPPFLVPTHTTHVFLPSLSMLVNAFQCAPPSVPLPPPQVVGLKRLAPYIEHTGGKAQRPNYKALEALKQQGPQQGVWVWVYVACVGGRGASRGGDGTDCENALLPRSAVAPSCCCCSWPLVPCCMPCQRAGGVCVVKA